MPHCGTPDVFLRIKLLSHMEASTGAACQDVHKKELHVRVCFVTETQQLQSCVVHDSSTFAPTSTTHLGGKERADFFPLLALDEPGHSLQPLLGVLENVDLDLGHEGLVARLVEGVVTL